MTLNWRRISVPPPDGERIAWLLIEHGWRQISRRYAALARLPDGKTGIEALAEAASKTRSDARKWAEGLGEVNAANHFRRVYASELGLVIEVPKHVLIEFRKLGGKAA